MKQKIRDMEFKLDATEAERDAKEVELAEKTKELNGMKQAFKRFLEEVDKPCRP